MMRPRRELSRWLLHIRKLKCVDRYLVSVSSQTNKSLYHPFLDRLCIMLQRMFHICIALYIVLSVLFTTSSLLSSSSNSGNPQPGNLFTRDLQKQIVLESTDLEHHYVDESIILSKAFPHLMKPSQIIPYYLRASGTFNKDDVTITSIITSNRFEILARLAQRYQGISVFVQSIYATQFDLQVPYR